MKQRKIIKIDENKCNGCGDCIPNCPEGALQIIDGKARLISDLFCDGLGACIGNCPYKAISIEEREAQEYDEKKVMENIVKQGKATIKAHLEHLRDHGAAKYLKIAFDFLRDENIEIPMDLKKKKIHSGCPGTRAMNFSKKPKVDFKKGPTPSALRQWPIQLHLVPVQAPYFQGKDVLLSADCIAYSLGGFHQNYLQEKSLAIACPKLDSNKDIYTEKISALIDEAKIGTLTVMIMEVPCCRGLVALVQQALNAAKRKIPAKEIVVGIKGNILSENNINISV